MRALHVLTLGVLAVVSACVEEGACQDYCERRESCGHEDADICMDGFAAQLASQLTRGAQLRECAAKLDDTTECDETADSE